MIIDNNNNNAFTCHAYTNGTVRGFRLSMKGILCNNGCHPIKSNNHNEREIIIKANDHNTKYNDIMYNNNNIDYDYSRDDDDTLVRDNNTDDTKRNNITNVNIVNYYPLYNIHGGLSAYDINRKNTQ